MRKIIPLVSLLASAMLVSCGGDNDKHDMQEGRDSSAVVVKDTTPVTVTDTTKFKFDFALANIPSPATSMKEVGSWGLPYDNSVFNHHKNITKYATEHQKAMNLGVYNIDMAYAMVNDNGADVLKYMNNVMQLSEALGLKSAVENIVGKRAEQNIHNKDTLLHILDEIFVKSDHYLRSNERVQTAATMFAGSWIESLYIVTELGVKGSEQVRLKVENHLWEQRFHLGNLINVLNDFKDKKDVADLITDLKPIQEEIMAVKKPKEMEGEKFKSISGKIEALREKITN